MRPRQFKPLIDEPVDNLYNEGNPLEGGALIRITGGHRDYDGGVIRTSYSWTLALHPSKTEPSTKPIDLGDSAAIRGGPKEGDSSDQGWPAIEASGNDNVPTDGTVVVLAFPSPTQDYLVFIYRPKILARIDAKNTSGSTTWWSWTEMEPAARVAGGQEYSVKLGGLVGEEIGGKLKKPLFELSKGRFIVGSIVEVWAYPIRQDTSGDGGFLQGRPEAVVTELAYGDGVSVNEKQRVKWNGFGTISGKFKITVINAAGVQTTAAIPYLETLANIKTAIQALSNITTVNVTGTDGSDFDVEFMDDFDHLEPMQIDYLPLDSDGMFSDHPYFGSAGSGGGSGDFFIARLDCRDLVSGIWVYAWTEMEWTENISLATVLTGGRQGWPAMTGSVVRTVAGTGAIQEVQTATLCGQPPTSGTWQLGGAGGLAWNISASDLSTALTASEGAVIAATGSMTAGWVLTWAVAGARTLLSIDVSGLLPSTALDPACEINNKKIPLGTNVWMKQLESGGAYRFDADFGNCPGDSIPSFVPGETNFVTLTADGCFAAVQPSTCATPMILDGGGP